MGLFDFSRLEGFPALFGPNKTPVTADTVEAGWIFAFAIIYISFLAVLPGIQGNKKWYTLIRVTMSCLIGLILMLCNFGMEWEVARISTKTPYKAYTPAELESADLRIKLGLRGVNITMYVSEDHHVPKELEGETINYNERFWWSWGQGRLGFGPFAGEIQREFRRAQAQGVPLPILWIAEYFTFDGEGIRFGRHYMRAGWYAHIVIWAAFPTYLLANILFFSVLRYGAFFTFITGLLQIIACIIWGSVRNVNELVIPFEDDTLVTSFGAHFWLALFNGLACVLIGLAVWFMDLRYPEIISVFFGVDPLQDYEEHYYTPDELLRKTQKKTSVRPPPNGVEMGEVKPNGSAEPAAPAGQEDIYVLKRRSTLPSLQRQGLKRPEVAPRTRFLGAKQDSIQEEAEEQLYENTKQYQKK